MLREIRNLGFEYAELSHGIRISLLPGILESVDAGEIKISTLHNFCPLPIGVSQANPNLFRFSSLDTRERENAWRYSFKTVEMARRLNAKLVVLHLGSLDMKEYTEKLIDLVGAGQQQTAKYEKLCAEVIDRRELKKEKHLRLANEILGRLAAEAEGLGVKLGIENREALEEIPLESDFTLFFKEFSSPTICYWHDTGHAQIKENLGFIHHAMHLGSLAHRLAGFHIHDVQFPARDHCPPGSGMVDFGALKALVKPEHIKVFELNPGVAAEDLKRGVDHLKGIWGDE
jgi:sugar phosphate isomerase/epimerase